VASGPSLVKPRTLPGLQRRDLIRVIFLLQSLIAERTAKKRHGFRKTQYTSPLVRPGMPSCHCVVASGEGLPLISPATDGE